jgi:hypothetical protein
MTCVLGKQLDKLEFGRGRRLFFLLPLVAQDSEQNEDFI